MMSVDLGIDLGTASVLVYVKGKGVVLKEPSVVAFDRDTNVIKAIGEEARLMLGSCVRVASTSLRRSRPKRERRTSRRIRKAGPSGPSPSRP